MPANRVVRSAYILTSSEDSYTGQNAQNPATSRRIRSFIPQDDGQLHREAAEPKFIDQALSGPVVRVYNFNRNNDSGQVQRFYFAAARTTFIFDAGDIIRTCNLYVRVGAAWVQVTDVGTLSDAPEFRTKNNLLFLVDGVNAWTFDGTAWFRTGISIPYQGGFNAQGQFSGPPFWTPAIDNTASGTFSALDGRYYWFTNADQTSTRPLHESDSSAISLSTGAVTNKKIKVYQTPGLWSVTSGSKEITVAASPDAPGPTLPLGSMSPDPGSGPAVLASAFNGKTLYINGTLVGVVSGVDLTGGGDNVLVLQDNSPVSIAAGRPVLVDARCTHWNVYASEADASKVGQFLNLSIPVTQNLATTPVEDQSPFIDDPDTDFISVFRPVRNDRPPASRVLEVHKNRLWYVNDSKPNFFDFGANEEVTSGANGDSDECVPGAGEQYTAATGAQSTNDTELAGAGTSVSQSLPPNTAWSNPGNVSSGVAYATVSMSGSTTRASQYLEAKNFGFAIPATATILGMEVSFEALATPASHPTAPGAVARIIGLTLLRSGVVVPGDGSSNTLVSDTDLQTFNVPFTRGSSVYLWNNSWTPAIINAADFGVVFQAFGKGTGVTFSIRNVRVKIYYMTAVTGAPQNVTNTLSDLVNEVSFPDQSNRIRGLCSHGDALYMGSERQVFPLYGESIDDFALSQITAFNVGFFSRFGQKSTPYGLAFLSFDRKIFLYPSNGIPSGNSTEALLEFGLPLRNKLRDSHLPGWNEIVTEFYYFGIRNWFVIGFPDGAGAFQTYVFDFNTKGWFQLQRGFTSLSVFELDEGSLILVGGAEDGYVYVIDDQTGTYTTTDALPESTWRSALIAFESPDNLRVFNWLEIDVDNNDLIDDLTVTFWLDSVDVDDPGEGRTITMTKVGPTLWRGFPTGGTVCKRLLLEFKFASSVNAGVIRGIKLVAYPVRGLLGSPTFNSPGDE